MAFRRNTRRTESTLAFEALAIEGGLLSADWLARVAQLAAGGQGEADYRVPKGLNLRDEIGRYWRMAQAHWADFDAGRRAGADAAVVADRFVQALLRDCFGFSSLAATEPTTMAERVYPVRLVALGGRVPVVTAPAGGGVDALAVAYGDGGRRRSAFGLAQEYLNAADGARWGLVSDGCTLRIVRDNASLTRPAWIDADLARIFTEELYADFAALWLLGHETRFGRPDQPVDDCPLETWRRAGREEGTRAREHLRRGVEEAILALGQGFLVHPENQALRTPLQDGSLTISAYFQQLLRLVYRLIFLLTIEERGLLHPDGTEESARSLYAHGYSVRRLRDRAVKRSAHDRSSDLWEGAKVVFRALVRGEPVLGLPALAGIFAKAHCFALDASRLENRALLLAMFRLSWLRESTGLARVNWRDMGPEELGSVYESLLELVPQITKEGRQFSFATGSETKGNARKTSGSYYTPDSLVQVLLDSALEPVVADTIARNPARAADALLELSIVDPACGSGHFLLAAARRLASHVARLRANGTSSAADYRHALREVVGRCIFGVDLNPMAVELCKVGLWMEAVEPGLPLTFLDSHVQHGNALLGTTPELMANGVPDAAWDPIEGDDRRVASQLKRKNKAAAAGQRGMTALWSDASGGTGGDVLRAIHALEGASDADASALAKKESQWDAILGSDAYRHEKFVADAWCAAFVWPKQAGVQADAAPTNDLWRQLRDRQGAPPALTVHTVTDLATQYRFFHWHLQFPQVFARGGFDVVLGNPPWERVKLQEQEFFASRSDEIAEAVNAAARKKLIAELRKCDHQLWDAWCGASRRAEGESHLIRYSGRYPLCGRGDINTYAVFAEHNRAVVGSRGRAGFIVPTGVATDDTTKDYFWALVSASRLVALYDFENADAIFVGVHRSYKFCLVTVSGREVGLADLCFYAHSVAEAKEHHRHFRLSPADFEVLNPNTRTCPTFRSGRDAVINTGIYRRCGVFVRDGDGGANPWRVQVRTRLWHMAEDSASFRTRTELEGAGWVLHGSVFRNGSDEYVPLIEAKMVHAFDHRFGTYEGQTQGQDNQGRLPEFGDVAHADPKRLTLPRYWVKGAEVAAALQAVWNRKWLLGWRNIARSSDQRTMIAILVPQVAVGNASPLLFPSAEPTLSACLYGNLNSFALDYCARQKVGGSNVTYNYVKQLPVLPPATFEQPCRWSGSVELRDWIVFRVLELTYTAWDLEHFARDVGCDGPPFRWDSARRAWLRAELDAGFFHLYGLSRDDTDYVMDTFPIVRKNDEKAHGEYRTKRLILEVYDAMSESARTGVPYETRLDPPPADPRVAHPDTLGGRE